MRSIYSEKHRLQHGKAELIDGQLLPVVEHPGRADSILAHLQKRALGAIDAPEDYGLEPILRVHGGDFVRFLQTAFDRWRAEHGEHDALPLAWPTRSLRQIKPKSILGEISYYAFDAATPITAGTFTAAYSSAQVALTAAELVRNGERAAFALCRPPGHHATHDLYGGYCFLNNAAIAAQAFVDNGARVAVLDVDYHHGNGTQEIFYGRSDVYFASLHADPAYDFPYFLGYADETGEGDGRGCNLNLPLPLGTEWTAFEEALEQSLEHIESFAPDTLVISLGVDTYKDDPISKFRLESENFTDIGKLIATLDLPTLFVMEGGYAVDALGENVLNVLTGFEGRP